MFLAQFTFTNAFKLLVDYLHRTLNLLDSWTVLFFGYQVSIFGIMVAFVVLGFFASVWWRGARQ